MSTAELHLVLGAALAVGGGIIGEFWRESQSNRREIKLLSGELQAIVDLCTVTLAQPDNLSLSHYLPQWRAFTTQGAAVNRAWLRAIDDADLRTTILHVYLLGIDDRGRLRTICRERGPL